MSLKKCSRCKSGWEINEGESFCGWCGAKTMVFEVTYDTESTFPLYVDELKAKAEPITILLKIRNTGIMPITVEKHRLRE